jgi:ABC-2 type transport system permease protein
MASDTFSAAESVGESPRSPTAAPHLGAPPVPRRYGAVNQVGLSTLIRREVRRYLKVPGQTLVAPLISTVLFMVVFALAFGDRPWGMLHDVRYVDGLAPGLIMMAIVSNAFQNSASSMVIAKVQGNAVDFLMPPLSAGELATAFIIGAATRGLLIGLVGVAVVSPFANVAPANALVALYFAVVASVMFGAIGLIGGIWAEKFDNLAAVANFVITPLTFLSGTFYSIDALAEPFSTIGHWNPVFFLIDGFRAGFIGHADAPLLAGGLFSLGLTLLLCWTCWTLLRSGYRLKA